MKAVFFGTPAFAVPTLERLIESNHDVLAVVTQPDRKRGRGQCVSAAPVKQVAEAHQLPVLQPERLKDPTFVAALEALEPDIGVVAAYGKLLPDNLLELPRHGMVNVHASLLPKYRGAAPIHRAIMAGELETGVTIIQLVRAMDAGPMLKLASCPISPDDTSEMLASRLASLGADLLLTVVDELAAGRTTVQTQDHDRATFAPRLSRDDGVIDWRRSAADLHNQVRGLHPWPHAFSYLAGARYAILQSAVAECPEASRCTQPGEIVEATKDRLIVAAGGGSALAIQELQPEGKRPLPTRAFLAGHRLEPGARFGQTLA